MFFVSICVCQQPKNNKTPECSRCEFVTVEQRKAVLRRVERDYEEAEEIVSLVCLIIIVE
jgi:hypothetical protein